MVDGEEREWQTRKGRIDPQLDSLGWKVAPHDEARPLGGDKPSAIVEYPTDNGPADYALAADQQLLAVVEAKKLSLGPQNVLAQSERYSRGASANLQDHRGYRVPFLYSTNGEVIWFHDIRDPMNRSRQITDFHTPNALRELLKRDFAAACARLKALPNNHERLRPYQREANDAVEKAIADRKRKMLVAMATGCGKTFLTVNQVYRLMKSGVAQRVLFLVDRKALAAQAVRTFAAFDPEPGLKFDKIYEVYSQRFRREDFGEEEKFDPKVLPTEYLTNPKVGDAFVYVSTIQRMAMNLFGRGVQFGTSEEEADEDADKLDIPIHAFDLIVADECHRGYTTAELSVWRGVLDHFDAIKVGLTATPAAHTKAYFDEIVYRYEYERAIREGYLVDYDVVTIKSNVRMNGVFLQEGEQVKLIDTGTGAHQLELLEDQRHFDAPEVERNVTSPDSNRKILEEVKKHALEHEARYGRFPKTLVFAANDLPHRSHADQLVDLARDVFGRGEGFAQKVTGSPTVDRPLQRIREFRNRNNPGIVVTVDLLSTGVDIPDLEFIVFLRPVKSRILFEQMLGRGTRKGERFPDKSHFTVFDCFDGTLLAYFRTASAFTIDPPEKPSRTIREIVGEIWANLDRDYNVRCLSKRLLRIDKEMSGEAREMFAAYIPGGDIAELARSLPAELRRDFTGTMKLLRDESFLELLEKYPRAAKRFVVAETTVDEVSSAQHLRGASGALLKPEDYLTTFARFVRENPAQIEAISILLSRPQDWSTAALNELRQKLSGTSERFTVEKLQKAVTVRYHKTLADIISIVKKAAKEEEPLLTAEERVDRALARITAGRAFTEAQRKWLDRIRSHLVQNLTIDREDFETVPVFTHDGGWKQADRAFEGKLGDLIRALNKEIAA
jgi:type I restriction enzyme R subunit